MRQAKEKGYKERESSRFQYILTSLVEKTEFQNLLFNK